MQSMRIPLVKGDRIEGVDYRDALHVNSLVIMKEVHGVKGYMLTHPGLTEYSSCPGRDRGAIYNERLGQHLRISGDKLVKVVHTGTDPLMGAVTELGAISGSSSSLYSQASLPYSFETQAIITDQKMWLYDGSTLSQVTDPDLGNPIDGIWIDGYYLMTDGETLFHTDLDDESSIEPTRYATSEFSPDPTIGLIKAQENQAVAFNRYTTEWFYHEPGNTAFKFNRIPAKAVKAGIVGTHTKIEMDGRFFCLGNAKGEAPTFLVISPGAYESLATREIDQILEEYTEAEMARGILEARVEEQNQLIYVRLPNHTLIFNWTVSKAVGKSYAWSIMKSSVVGDDPWVGANGVLDIAANQWIYGDTSLPRLGVLAGVSSQYGEQQESLFFSPFVNLETMSVDEFEIQTVPGFTLEDVTVFVSLTYDGRTWGKEWSLAYGGPLDYWQRFIARRLGNINHWVAFKFRVVSSSRVNFANMVIRYG